jgi:hypothetical protein
VGELSHFAFVRRNFFATPVLTQVLPFNVPLVRIGCNLMLGPPRSPFYGGIANLPASLSDGTLAFQMRRLAEVGRCAIVARR